MLRKYELEKLSSFYAIATFKNKEVATKVYEELDGKEVELTNMPIDMRFVPEGVTPPFKPVGSCKELPMKIHGLKENRAQGHSSVKLTWD